MGDGEGETFALWAMGSWVLLQYMEENHWEMMEEDKEMTPWGTPRIRRLLSVMVIVIVNMWRS